MMTAATTGSRKPSPLLVSIAPRKPRKMTPARPAIGAHEHQHHDAGPVDGDAGQARRVGIAAHRLHPVAEAGVLQHHVQHDRQDHERDRDHGDDVEQLEVPELEVAARPCPAAMTGLDSLTTSDRPRYTDSVPSVMMITGMRMPTASTPLIRPSSPPNAMPSSGCEDRIDARRSSACRR